MEPITLNANSWHYKLTSFFDIPYDRDICSYTRAVLKSLLLVTIIGGLAMFAAAALTDQAVWLVFCIKYHMWIYPNQWAQVGSLMAIVVGVFVGVIFSLLMLLEYRDNNPKPDGFIKVAYKSFKEKWCAPVVIKH